MTLRLEAAAPVTREVRATAWGSGAAWMLERVPDLLGERDDPTGFETHHRAVADAWRAFGGWRVPRSGLVVQALVPAVIEQKVTGQEAFAGYRRLVRRFGEPAPGPVEALRLVVPPDAAGWAGIPSWEWLAAGVDPQRSRTVVRAVGHAGRLEECASLPAEAARARLRAVPGVGRWTWAEVAQRALGLPDEVSFGDYHVAKDIGWALTGTPVDDDGLADSSSRMPVTATGSSASSSRGCVPSATRSPDGAAHPPARAWALTPAARVPGTSWPCPSAVRPMGIDHSADLTIDRSADSVPQCDA